MRDLNEKRNIWLWMSYDFANSFAYIIVSFYFALWFIGEKGGGSFWVSAPVALATIALLVSLPTVGMISDNTARRLPFLRWFTFLAALALLGLGVAAVGTGNLAGWRLGSVIILYFLFNYFYQAALAFYHSLLPDLAKSRTREHLSGYGYAFGQLGNIAGLLAAIPVAQANVSLLGATGRPATFIVGAAAFFVLALPSLIFFKEPARNAVAVRILSSFKKTLLDLKNLSKQYPGVFYYLITFYLFADAMMTIQLFGTIYFEIVGRLNDGQKTLVGVVMLLAAALGAALSGFLYKRVGNTKKAIAGCILLWAAALAVTALVSSVGAFIILSIANGLVYGCLFSLSRAFYSQLAPPSQQAEFFGVYVLFEKFASVLGPLLWSLTLALFAFAGTALSYRLAVVSQALLVVLSLLFLRLVKPPLPKQLISINI